jgi:hypothetical protein
MAEAKGNGMDDREIEKALKRTLIKRERMSPKGGLGLPALLDERRLEYDITDKAWDSQASFDRVYLYQITQIKDNRYAGSKIILADTTQARERNTAPRAIIVSAGLTALDQLRSHGIDLGHIVYFVVSAPYHVRYDVIEGKDEHLIIVNAGDICGSEDLANKIRDREAAVSWSDENNQHVLRIDGENRVPMDVKPTEY